MSKLLSISAVLACVATVYPGAAFAAPFTLTSVGGEPFVAVDGAGNGHFVWNEGLPADPDVTHYCRVPRGGTDCAISRTFVPISNSPTNNEDFDGPKVFVGGSTVIVMTHRCCGGYPPAGSDGTIIYTSTDNGQTFDSGQVVGTADISGDAIVGPTGQLSTISDVVTGGTFYQALAPGSFTSASANLGNSGSLQSYSGSLGLIDANTPIATFDDLDTTFWRRYAGSGSYNDVASWTPTATVGPGADGTLASGPNGVWLLYLTGDPGDRRYVARRFTGAGFGSPVNVTPIGDPIFADFFQDPSGRTHAVWVDDGRDLVYRRADNATGYGPITQLAPANFNIFHLQVAAGADGEGWVAWDENSVNDRVRAAPLQSAPAQPTLGETVTVGVVKGEVLIKLPAGSSAAGVSQNGAGFVPLTETRTIPVRSILDTTSGTVRLRAARNRAGKLQSGQFSQGVFQVLQSRKRRTKGLTELRLKGSAAGFRSCRNTRSASAALSRRAVRRLRSKAKGRYRTRGKHSAATVRGTTWTVTDRCDGTLTKVKRGRVAVRDFRLRRTIVVGAGKSYLARPR
jgi:hypothetical protein